MRNFYVLWLGQTVSLIGSRVTTFALMLWLWDVTNQAAPLAIITFINLIAPLSASIVAGVIVDRFTRKWLMLCADMIAGLTTLILMWLSVNEQLMIWHVYVVVSINSFVGYFQSLSFSTSISLIVPKNRYNRANAMNSYLGYYSASIISPGIAAVLYTQFGLEAVFLLDMLTFLFALVMLLFIHIPQPASTPSSETWRGKITFGWRYIRAKPHLWLLLVVVSLIGICSTAAGAIYAPMILAQSDSDTYAFLQVFVGVGGVFSAALLSLWRGPNNLIKGVFVGYMLMGVFNMGLALGQTLWIWLPFAVLAGMTGPIPGTYLQTLWMKHTEPEVQGRVFATNYLFSGTLMGIASLGVGFLADYVFIPLMRKDTPLNNVFGKGDGAGLSLLYFMLVFTLLLVAYVALRLKQFDRLQTVD
ncbi:MAG: MFS transporter [Chloroflexi bacterium]|nr:MAG: MFS transporter [Chloroflexota bacterium]